MFTKAFWADAIERAVKTAAQATILGLGLGEGFNAFDVDWQLGAGFAVGGAVLSLLTSLASSSKGTAQAFVNTYDH